MGITDLAWQGWLDGGTATAIILSSTIFGILCIIKGVKNKAKLMTLAGISCFCIGSFWLGPFLDFLMVLLFNTHITPYHIYGILSYTLIGPGVLVVAILGGELIAPNYKKLLVIVMLITGVAFEVFLWGFTTDSFEEFKTPEQGHLLDASYNRGFFTFFFIVFFLVYMLIFMATGFAIKAKQSSGELRKKFTFLAVAFYIFVITGIFDALLPVILIIGIVRMFMATFAIWMYLGLKT